MFFSFFFYSETCNEVGLFNIPLPWLCLAAGELLSSAWLSSKSLYTFGLFLELTDSFTLSENSRTTCFTFVFWSALSKLDWSSLSSNDDPSLFFRFFNCYLLLLFILSITLVFCDFASVYSCSLWKYFSCEVTRFFFFSLPAESML